MRVFSCLCLVTPAAVLVLSPFLSLGPGLEHRRDDGAFAIVFGLGIILSVLVVVLRGRISKPSSSALAITVWIALAAWVAARASSLVGLLQYAFMLASMLLPICVVEERISRPHQPRMKFFLWWALAYSTLVLGLMAIHPQNEDFMKVTGMNVNVLLVPVLPILVFYAVGVTGLRSLIAGGVFFLSSLAIAVLSGSKQSVLLVAIPAALLLIRSRGWLRYAWAIVLVAIAGAFLAWNEQVYARLSEFAPLLAGRIDESPSAASRLGAWALYGTVVQANPIAGTGIGSLESAFNTAEIDADAGGQFLGEFRTPHNSWLRLLVEGGGILCALVAIFHYSLVKALQGRISHTSGRVLCGSTLSLLSLLLSGFLTESMFSWVYWLAVAQTSFLHIRASECEPPRPIPSSYRVAPMHVRMS